MGMQLNKDWTPDSARNHTWLAMDKNRYLAIVLNNGHGWLPKTLLEIVNIKETLSDLGEYIDGDSIKYINNINKNGGYTIDLYSSWAFEKYKNKKQIIDEFNSQLEKNDNYCDSLLATKMRLFFYQAVEGYSKGEDYLVGYDGETKMGDYYRFIVPTIYATIEDIPQPLRQYVVVSDSLDFTQDRLLDNDKISEYFTRMYK